MQLERCSRGQVDGRDAHRTEKRGPVPEASCQVMRLKEATVSILKANKEVKGTVTTTFIAER